MNLFTALKNLSPFHFNSLHVFSLILSTLHFTLHCNSYLQLTSFNFTSLHFLSHCILPQVWSAPEFMRERNKVLYKTKLTSLPVGESSQIQASLLRSCCCEVYQCKCFTLCSVMWHTDLEEWSSSPSIIMPPPPPALGTFAGCYQVLALRWFVSCIHHAID